MRRPKGEGSLRERQPGVWEARLSLHGEPYSATFHGDEKTVRRAHRRWLAAVESGEVEPRRKQRQKKVQSTERTFRAAAQRWLALAGDDFSPGTLRNYRQNLRVHIYPAIGDVPLDELTTETLDDLYLALKTKGLSPKTVRQVHGVISGTLKMASKWKWNHAKPTADVTLPRPREREIIAPEPRDVLNFIAEATADGNEPLATLFALAAATGARRGELCALRWTDVDFSTSTLTIARSITATTEGLKEKDTKSHAIRAISVDRGTVRELRRHYTKAVAHAADAEVVLAPNAFVFSNSPSGETPWDPDYITTAFRTIRKRLNLPDSLRMHSLRHFSASQLLAAGVDVRTVSGRHGWKDATMLLTRYGHFMPAADAKAADVMGELLTPDAKESRALPPAEGTESAADGAS